MLALHFSEDTQDTYTHGLIRDNAGNGSRNKQSYLDNRGNSMPYQLDGLENVPCESLRVMGNWQRLYTLMFIVGK